MCVLLLGVAFGSVAQRHARSVVLEQMAERRGELHWGACWHDESGSSLIKDVGYATHPTSDAWQSNGNGFDQGNGESFGMGWKYEDVRRLILAH